MATLSFWYDFASTYSYLAAMRLEDEAAQVGVAVHWRPFLLGPIFGAQGLTQSPFTANQIKGAYMWRDMERLAQDFKLPWKKPNVFPRGGVNAHRVAIAGIDAGIGPELTRAIYRANFVDDCDIHDLDVLRGLVSGLSDQGDAIMAAAGRELAKAQLRENTAIAQSIGLFGAPSFSVGSELFWGHDRMTQALNFAARV
jgi:2-hydroxychromene-2-carboxylate isomerase